MLKEQQIFSNYCLLSAHAWLFDQTSPFDDEGKSRAGDYELYKF